MMVKMVLYTCTSEPECVKTDISHEVPRLSEGLLASVRRPRTFISVWTFVGCVRGTTNKSPNTN